MKKEITVEEVILHWRRELARIQVQKNGAKISGIKLPKYVEIDERIILKTLELLGDINEQTANA
jgi:hypothetical protein